MIIAATGYFKVVTRVGVSMGEDTPDPIPQRVVLRLQERPKKFQVGVQRQDEGILRGMQSYPSLRNAWIDFEEYTSELVEDGYLNERPERPEGV